MIGREHPLVKLPEKMPWDSISEPLSGGVPYHAAARMTRCSIFFILRSPTR